MLVGRTAGLWGCKLPRNLGKGTGLGDTWWGFTKKVITCAFCHMMGNYSHKDRFWTGWVVDDLQTINQSIHLR